MTLGGFALAVGILVDNSTVVIENIERHRSRRGCPSPTASSTGPTEIGIPTLLSTLSICIVFVSRVPAVGVAKYLFSPLSLAVLLSLLASLASVVHGRAGDVRFPDAPRRTATNGDGHDARTGSDHTGVRRQCPF